MRLGWDERGKDNRGERMYKHVAPHEGIFSLKVVLLSHVYLIFIFMLLLHI